MGNRKKYKIQRTPRYEVTARIDGIGVRKHVMTPPVKDPECHREAIAGKLARVYPNRDVTILRIVERR